MKLMWPFMLLNVECPFLEFSCDTLILNLYFHDDERPRAKETLDLPPLPRKASRILQNLSLNKIISISPVV